MSITMDFDLMKHGLAIQGAELNTAKVLLFPTPELARRLHAQGKRIVHRPTKAGDLQAFEPSQPEPPEAA